MPVHAPEKGEDRAEYGKVNQISGRLSELKFDGLITTTGLRRHPVSGIMCDVYAITETRRVVTTDDTD